VHVVIKATRVTKVRRVIKENVVTRGLLEKKVSEEKKVILVIKATRE
jgi:hypothetical protein